MEPRLLQSLVRKWWMFLIVLAITAGATLFLTMRQTPVYRSKATYIMRLSSEITDTKSISTALDTLNRYNELLGTYSEIAMSQMIKRQAGTRLGISGPDRSSMSVSSRTVPGSKVLEISVEGPNPELVRSFAEAVGEETITYVNDLYPAYRLTLLDDPSAPGKPISPQLTLNLVLGIVLGGFLGLTAVFLSIWLRGELKSAPAAENSPQEGLPLPPVQRELESLLEQLAWIRAELSETREAVRNTESQAKAISTLLANTSRNGSSHGKEKKAAVARAEEDGTGYSGSESPN